MRMPTRTPVVSPSDDGVQEPPPQPRACVHRLPPPNRALLQLLCRHLARVARHAENRMDARNLSLTVGMNLCRSDETLGAMQRECSVRSKVALALIRHHAALFATERGGLSQGLAAIDEAGDDPDSGLDD